MKEAGAVDGREVAGRDRFGTILQCSGVWSEGRATWLALCELAIRCHWDRNCGRKLGHVVPCGCPPTIASRVVAVSERPCCVHLGAL